MTSAYHILMLLSNGYKPDPRVQIEARGLVDCGFRVSVLCWDRRKEHLPREVDEGVEIIRVQNVPSGYGQGWRQMSHFPRFWLACTRFARSANPDAIHCHDLDTLYAGWRIKRQLKSTLIYDAHEHYPAMMSLYLPKIMIRGLEIFEAKLVQKADATITASTLLADEFMAKGINNIITLGNYASYYRFSDVDDDAVNELRHSLRAKPDDLIVGYIGGLSRNRELLPLIESAGLLSGVQIHIWGNGQQVSDVRTAAKGYGNVFYHGWLPPEQLPIHFNALDIVYYGLRVDYPGAIYNAPNTLGQAMASGRPIIATNVGDLGRIVSETRCGLLLQNASPNEIAATIDRLNSKELREQLGASGQMAAEGKYNAADVQNRLVQLYSELLDKEH